MVNPTSKTQMTRALLSLREQILSGEFRPGERMSELRLVERIGVSRTPLRLALSSLEHEGLLRALPGGGYAVREFTLSGRAERITCPTRVCNAEAGDIGASAPELVARPRTPPHQPVG